MDAVDSLFNLGLVLALVSSLAWMIFDATRKQVVIKLGASGALATLLLAQVLCMSSLLLLARLELWPLPLLGASKAWPPAYSRTLALIVVLNIGACWAFMRAVEISPLSLTIPYLSFTPVFTALFDRLWTGEELSVGAWLGIALIALGAFALNAGDKNDGWLAPLKALRRETGTLLMLAVSAIWGIVVVFDKTALEWRSPLDHGLAVTLSLALVFLVARVIKDRQLTQLWRDCEGLKSRLAFGGLVATVAVLGQLASYHWLKAAYMETVKRVVGILGALLLSALLFKDDDPKQRLPGALIMIVGVAVLILNR